MSWREGTIRALEYCAQAPSLGVTFTVLLCACDSTLTFVSLDRHGLEACQFVEMSGLYGRALVGAELGTGLSSLAGCACAVMGRQQGDVDKLVESLLGV